MTEELFTSLLPCPLCVILTKSTGSNNGDAFSGGSTTNDEQIAFFQNADEVDKRSNQLEEELYQVEKIVGAKTQNGEKLFLVKWHGYPESENSWEPKENLDAGACEYPDNPDISIVW